MAGGGSRSSLLRGFLSLFFVLFLHIGHAACCFSPGSASQQHEEDAAEADGKGTGVGSSSSKRRKISPLAFSPAASSSSTVAVEERVRARRSRRHVSSLAANLRCYLHRIFSSSGPNNNAAGRAAGEEEDAATLTTTLSSPLPQSSSMTMTPQQQHLAATSSSMMLSPPPSPCTSSSPLFLYSQSPMSPRSLSVTPPVPCSPARRLSRSFAARGDLFPCKSCGEVLSKPQQLELHQATKHSLSELSVLDSSTNIIRMIFLAGWSPSPPVAVRRVLRIHHNPRALARFEEYRGLVRARAARRSSSAAALQQGAGAAEEERCIADGNERLRFHCATALCSQLGSSGSSGGGGVCGSPYCCACTILRHGFAGKQADVDGIATYSSGRAAHASLPEEVEREFAFLQVRRAMLVCRVVAGRVVVRGGGAAAGDGDKVGYDSMVPATPVGAGGGGRRGEGDADQLLVFNPRAVLPCFVIMYSS